MSKKKMPRAVMTLKDFHGGSIPSDLPLPSAPGMTVDRSAYERQGSGAWSSPSLGRGYGSNDRGIGHFRQGSGNGVRTFEDKASFFPNPANIGRNYEEDERKPVDGRPRSGQTDRYEDIGYEEQHSRSDYEKTVDRFSMEEQGGYASASRPDRFGRAAESGQAESQGYRPYAVSAYATESVAPVSRNQSSYTQASQYNMARARPASPPGTWRQQTQQPTAAAVTRGSGPNVWPPRQDGESTRMAEPVQIESKSAAPWRAQLSGSRPDIAIVEKAPQGRWQSEPDRQGSSHYTELKQARGPVYSESNVRRTAAEAIPPPYVSERPQGLDTTHVGYGAQGGQANYSEGGRAGYVDGGRGGHMESGSGSYLDGGRRSFADDFTDAGGRGTYQEPSRVSYADDGGRRRINDERSLGYDEPLRSGNSERITFSDSGRPVYTEGGRYGGESTQVVDYPENGRRDYRDSGRIEYVEAGRERESVDNSRGGYGDLGRGSQENAGRGGYTDRGRPGNASVHGNYADNSQGSSFQANSGRSTFNMEGGRDSYGPVSTRGSYPVESSPPSSYPREGGYGVDSSVAPYVENQDQSRSPFGVEKPYISNGSRSPPVENNRGGYFSSESGPADNSRGAAQVARAEPVAERPRLKLLPRTKPLEAVTPVAAEVGMSEDTVKEFVPEPEEKGPAEVLTLDGSKFDGNDGGDDNTGNFENNEDSSRPVERPKLNLKPRSQPAEPGAVLDGSGIVRQNVFGGARPRELVLKERGVDDIAPVVSELAPMPLATIPSKPDRQEGGRTEVTNTWGDEKQEPTRRYEPRATRSLEKQGFSERQDGNPARGDLDRKDVRRNDWGDFERQDSKERYESNRPYDRQESRNRDGDRQDVPRRDIDKQDSWRRPASPTPAAPTPPASLDTSNRQNSGRFGYTAPTSAVELAQAFSRSSSLGSPIVGVTRINSGNQRGPISPGIRGPGQGYGASGYGAGLMNGNAGGYGSKDAPFSRLAEAPPVAQMYAPGGGQGNGRATNGYDSSNRGYGSMSGSGDQNWLPSYGRSDDDFPGKRGLPLRRPYE